MAYNDNVFNSKHDDDHAAFWAAWKATHAFIADPARKPEFEAAREVLEILDRRSRRSRRPAGSR